MSVNINSKDFLDNFDVSELVVGVVGDGYVGRAISTYFKTECKVLVYDKFNPDLSTLEEVIRESHIVFVAVPTPMESDGRCHTGIVESVFDDINRAADRVSRSTADFVTVLKSTVPPGFTERSKKMFGLRLVFSPEFLTEKSSIDDFANMNRIILGGDDEDTMIVFKFFERKISGRDVKVVGVEPTVAEMVKMFTNAMLMTKVLFGNEIYKVCRALGISYDEVSILACLDRRIAYSHLTVPGPDGQLGAGGHCFPKDINSLRKVAEDLGTEEKLFTAVIERNDELRDHKDWLEMKGRAVVE